MKKKILIDHESRSGKNSYAYIMPLERSVNIDTLDDLKFAEKLLKKVDVKINQLKLINLF